MQQNHNIPAVNPLPPVVILLVVALAAAEGFLYLQSLGFLGGVAGLDGRAALVREFWLPGLLQGWMFETGRFEPEYLKLYLTFLFVHGSFTHTIFTAVFVLALGNFVCRALGALRFLLAFFVPAVVGAMAYGLVGDGGVLIGGMPGAYGLIGAFTWLMWAGVVRHGIGASSPFAMIGFLVLFRLLMSGLYGWRWESIADWAGFLAGFALMFVLVPGGRALVLRLLRRR